MDHKEISGHMDNIEKSINAIKGIMGGARPMQEEASGKPEQSYNDPIDNGEQPGEKSDKKSMFMAMMKRKLGE